MAERITCSKCGNTMYNFPDSYAIKDGKTYCKFCAEKMDLMVVADQEIQAKKEELRKDTEGAMENKMESNVISNEVCDSTENNENTAKPVSITVDQKALQYLEDIAEKVSTIKGWITFWSVLTIIGMAIAIISILGNL